MGGRPGSSFSSFLGGSCLDDLAVELALGLLAGSSSSVSFGEYVSDLGIRTNRLSSFVSFSTGCGCFCNLAASALVTLASSMMGNWSIIPRSGGSYEGILEAEDSLAKDFSSSSTKGRGGSCLREPWLRLRLRVREVSWEAERYDDALLEVGALGQTLALPDREEAITNPDGLLPLDVLKYPVVRSSLISRRGGGASMVDLGG